MKTRMERVVGSRGKGMNKVGRGLHGQANRD